MKMTQITFDTSDIMYVCDIDISYNNKDIEYKFTQVVSDMFMF